MKSSRLRSRVLRFVKVGKGVSQVVAVLLMIAIAVIAALVSYFWVMGYFKSTGGHISNGIQIQSVAYTGTHLVAYVQNVGKGTVHLISNQCFYVDGALRTEASENPNTLQVNVTASIIDNMTLSMGQKIQLKVVTTEGTFALAYFTVNKFTGDYTLSLLIVGGGNVTEVPSGSTYYYDNVQLTASPDPHWTFSGWSGDLSGTTNPTSILVNKNVAVTATFVAIQHTVTFNQNGVGHDFTGNLVTIDGNGYNFTELPQVFTWDEGSQHSFSFNSPLAVGTDTQYIWTSTSGLSTNQNDSQFMVPNSDGTINGNYGTQYYLTVDNGGQGAESGQGWYNASSSATFNIGPTVIPGGTGIQYNFTGWAGSGSGSYTGTGASQSVTMNNPINETAQWMTQYQVTFAVNPLGNGTTTPSGTGWFDAGANVTISATATTVSYKFTSWSTTDNIAFANPSSNSTVATINGPGKVTANFAVNTEQITIDSNPEGPGFVNVDGKNYTTPNTFTWTAGDTHTLEALSPVPGATGVQYNFTSWSDGGSQTHVYTVPTSSDTVTANYATQFQITFSQVGLDSSAYGTVVAIDGTTKSYSELPFGEWINSGTTVTYSYSNVSSNTSGVQFRLNTVTGPASPITVTGATNVTGNYVTQYQVSFVVSPAGYGTTSPSGTGYYDAGTLQISANANTGHKFVVWGNATGSITIQTPLHASTNATINGPGTITANFASQTFIIIASAGTGGTISPSGTVPVNYGANQIFQITADSGYYITSVIVNGTQVGNVTRYTFTNVQNNYAITASFARSLLGGSVFNNFAVSPSSQVVGGNVSVSGNLQSSIIPAGLPGMDVTLTYTQPDGTTIVKKVTTTDYSGYFSDTYNVGNNVGTWSVQASFAGNGLLGGAPPATITFIVGYPISVTVTSSQTGSGFASVDGTPITTPQTFAWVAGSTHTLVANSTVSGGTGVQYVYTGWSDGGPQTHTYTVPSSPATVMANYVIQYQVTFSISPSGSGTTTPSGSPWENLGPLPISTTNNQGYRFSSWSATGLITLTNPSSASTTATINGTGTITAMFTQNPPQTVTLRPNGAGHYQELNQSPNSGNHYTKVSEATSDGDATYVYTTNTSTQRDSYTFTSSSATGTINSVTIYVVARATSGGTASTVLRISGSSYYGGSNTLTTTYSTYSTQYTSNPVTGNAWTWADINSLDAGVRLARSGSSGNDARCTQIYIVVNYTPP